MLFVPMAHYVECRVLTEDPGRAAVSMPANNVGLILNPGCRCG